MKLVLKLVGLSAWCPGPKSAVRSEIRTHYTAGKGKAISESQVYKLWLWRVRVTYHFLCLYLIHLLDLFPDDGLFRLDFRLV